jgi:histidine triad (HIT) family protein
MDDFYCSQIISGKVKIDVVFETERVIAFHHTNPYFEQHIVIIPKEHIDSLSSYSNDKELNYDFFEAIKFVTNKLEKSYGGCRVSSNVGEYQSTKHLHWYVHYGERLRTEAGELIKK